MRRVPKVYDYPHDAEWDDRESLIDWADIVHAMEIPAAIPSGKPAVLHHHGSYARANPGVLRVPAIHICSTLDLHLAGFGQWVPSAYDMDSLAQYRKPSEVLTVAHAPTSRDLKSTDAFLAACERLPVRVLLIEGQSWAECLRMKGTADIYFDQVQLGYGNNAVEAWGMGIPVIAGAAPATLAEMERRFGGLPFVRADEETIYDALRSLLDPGARRYWGERGRAHARRFHDERVVVKQLEAIYRSLL